MNEMIDVLLISSPSSNPYTESVFSAQGMPPLGLGYIATYLKKNGYSAIVFDMNFRFNTIYTLLDYVNKVQPKVIGISCTTESYNNALKIAHVLKKHSGQLCIVVGGPHVSFEYQNTLESSNDVDYVVINEGELSFKKICDYHIGKKIGIDALTGIAYKRNGRICRAPLEPFIECLDELPIPDRTLFLNFDQYPVASTISTSRGCPGKCVFCAASVLSGGKYRMRSAKGVVDEFEYLKSLGYNHVTVIDDTMTVNKKRLYEFTDELVNRKLSMTWFCESRVDIITREMLLKMKSAGLTQIQFGVESGSQEILNSIKKGINLADIRSVFKLCKELHIQAVTNLIIGQPQDTNETIESTLLFGKELMNLGAQVSYTICTPFPGTPLWTEPERFGIEIIDHDLEHYSTFQPVIKTKYLGINEIRNWYFKAIKNKNKIVNRNLEDVLKRHKSQLNY